MKIYTRTGDAGETSLFDGTRVSKADPRVDAYGEVDELNAWLGFARAAGLDADLDDAAGPHPARSLRARRAAGRSVATGSPSASPRRCSATPTSRGSKQLIDRLETELPPLRRFILPAARRPAPRSTSREPSAAAPSGASSR